MLKVVIHFESIGDPVEKAYNKDGGEIGQFDGRFVRDTHGEKLYLILGEDVFSVPHKDTETHFGRSACLGIGRLSGEVAIDEEGAIVFTTNRKLLDLATQPEDRRD